MLNSFLICTHTKHYHESEIKNGDLGRTCDIMGERRNT